MSDDRDQEQQPQQQLEQEPARAACKACDEQQQPEPLNSWEARQDARRARLLDRAQAARGKSEQLHGQAHRMADAIPFGQPILIGHHSEGRDRRYRERIHSTFGKAFKELDHATDLERRAAAVGKGGISSDDPDAINKLQKQLADIEESQAKMKAANVAIRKGKSDDAKVTNLLGLGFTEAMARELIKPDFCGRIGFPSYALSNNNANGHRIKARIAQLERAKSATSVAIAGSGYDYQECTTENRVMFIFPGKPNPDTRSQLKKWGFKWSPTRNAWVRQLNNAGRWAGQSVRTYLDSLTS